MPGFVPESLELAASSDAQDLAIPTYTPKYQYLVCDLLTDQVWASVNFTGVTFERRLSRPGSWKGQMRISNRSQALMADQLSSNVGRLAVWVLRDKQVWWGGILWNAAPAVGGRGYDTVDFQGSSFESYPYRLAIDYDWAFDNATDMAVKVIDIWSSMQAFEASSNIDVITDHANAVNLANNFLPTAFVESDIVYYGDMIQAYTDDPVAGVDYTIDVYTDSSGNRAKKVKTAGSFKDIVNPAPPVVSGYRIPSYGIMRDTADMGTTFKAWINVQQANAATEAKPIESPRYVAQELLDEGWPRLDVRAQLDGTFSSGAAAVYANFYAKQMKRAQSGVKDVITYEVDLSTNQWHPNMIGQNITVKHSKRDLWYPGQTKVMAPVLAEFTAAERGTPERVKFSFNNTREVRA